MYIQISLSILVTIKEHNQELFTQPLEMLKHLGVHATLTVLRDEIQQLQSCRPQIPKNPTTVIALLVILGDLYSNQDFTRQQLCFASEIIELLVQWMVKHCSLVSPLIVGFVSLRLRFSTELMIKN